MHLQRTMKTVSLLLITGHVILFGCSMDYLPSLGKCRNEGAQFCSSKVNHSVCLMDDNVCACNIGFVVMRQDDRLLCKQTFSGIQCRFDYECFDIPGSICHAGVGRCICPANWVFVQQFYACEELSNVQAGYICQECTNSGGQCILVEEYRLTTFLKQLCRQKPACVVNLFKNIYSNVKIINDRIEWCSCPLQKIMIQPIRRNNNHKDNLCLRFESQKLKQNSTEIVKAMYSTHFRAICQDIRGAFEMTTNNVNICWCALASGSQYSYETAGEFQNTCHHHEVKATCNISYIQICHNSKALEKIFNGTMQILKYTINMNMIILPFMNPILYHYIWKRKECEFLWKNISDHFMSKVEYPIDVKNGKGFCTLIENPYHVMLSTCGLKEKKEGSIVKAEIRLVYKGAFQSLAMFEEFQQLLYFGYPITCVVHSILKTSNKIYEKITNESNNNSNLSGYIYAPNIYGNNNGNSVFAITKHNLFEETMHQFRLDQSQLIALLTTFCISIGLLIVLLFSWWMFKFLKSRSN